MRKLSVWVLLVVLVIVPATACTSMDGGNAKQQALQALVTTTRSAVLLMTAAGIAYDAGAFGAPGSANAEATWNRIAAQSRLMHGALNEWQEAVKAGKDASAFASIVGQALAIIGSILPPATRASAERLPYPTEAVELSIGRLACPDGLRMRTQLTGGAL